MSRHYDGKSDVPQLTAFRLLDQMKRQGEEFDAREKLMVGSLLTGRAIYMFGKPVRITLEWVNGLPGGFTAEDLRQIGEDMYRKAGGQSDTGLSEGS